MNNRKSIAFLLFAIAVLLAANLMMRSDARRTAVTPVRTLVDGGVEFSRLVVSRKGAPPTVLEKSAEWRIVQPFLGAADEQTVLKTLDALSFTSFSDVISDSELLKIGRSRADFALVEPVLSVTVSGGPRTTEISFGGPTPTADGVYASIGGSDTVVIVPAELFAAVDRPADDFRRRSLFSLEVESVAAFDIKRGTEAPVTCARQGAGWAVGDVRAEERKVRKFLTDLLSTTAVGFVWPTGATNETERASAALLSACGLDPENAVTVTLKGVDGVSRPITFGKNADEKLAYALVQNGMAVVTLPLALRDAAVRDPALLSDSRLFPVDAASVSLFSLLDGDMTCVLSRDAGAWRLESPVVAPAEPSVVEAILERILALSSADATAETSGLTVSLTTNAAPARVRRDAVLGKNRLEDLRSRNVVKVDPLLVKRIVRTTGEEDAKPTSVVYVRDRRAWNLESEDEGAKADEKGISEVLSALNPLVAVRVEKLKVPAADMDDYGLDRPVLTVAVDQDREDVVRRNILVGGKTDGGRFATVGSSDAVFVISEETVRRLSSSVLIQD